jgi:hypothetical protein
MIRTAIAAVAANADADQSVVRLGMAEGGVERTGRSCMNGPCLDHPKADSQNKARPAPREN